MTDEASMGEPRPEGATQAILCATLVTKTEGDSGKDSGVKVGPDP